ncbi:uncharacterized protein LOC133326824, partial [Musca vetustissima]|uniref:uncharacterized protein LOC133326824 n=1 Tax=Musca vetustissima TaxID=27455 RepID=UPI002AB6CF2F
MRGNLDLELLTIGSTILEYQRQRRVFIVALNVKEGVEREDFKVVLLRNLENYKMTNVLLYFLQGHQDMSQPEMYVLKPYPSYHWHKKSDQDTYYPPHWRNMRNKTLITLNGQDPPAGLVYLDANGRYQMNGYMARLIMLFAERFNATLEMHKSFKFGNMLSYRSINELSLKGELDIPMASSFHSDNTFPQIQKTVYYEMIKPFMMVPCPKQLTYREVFAVILNKYFFGGLVGCYLLLSVIHTVVDFYFDGLWNFINFILNEKILPGLFGQAFISSNSPWRSLKIVYLLVSFIGLNIAVLFGANIKTLFTQPPYHKYIETHQDLRESPIKILTDTFYAQVLTPFYGKDSVVTAPSDTAYLKQKSRFNSSYAYFISSTEWKALFSRRQQFYKQKQFCIARQIIPQDFFIYSILLQKNSPYLEPLNEHILRVHELGFMEAWQSSTFMDMMKLGNISLFDGYTNLDDQKILTVDDLFWIWMIVVEGCGLGM